MSQFLTEVLLLSVPLENDYKHTFYFQTAGEQESFFKTKKVYNDTGYTYLRKDSVLRYPRDVDDLQRHVNYIMYKNGAHSSKWYYAFITSMDYVNDGMTNIHFETDVLQTWMFDYSVKPSFIEREHTNNDEIGANTIEEGLEKGTYICNSYKKMSNMGANKIVLGATVNPEGEKDVGATYNGIYSGVKYYCFDTETEVTNALQTLADENVDAISCLFVAPSSLIESTGGIVKESANHNYFDYANSHSKSNDFQKQYTPKNNKLYTNPYCYLLVTNGNGASAIYNYEDFNTVSPTFQVISSLCPGMSVRLLPKEYKGCTVNFDEGLNLGKFPQCNWATDMYTNWLTQNGVNVATSIGTAIGNTALGFAVGGGIGAIGGLISGISQISNTVQEVKNAEMVAPQVAGNTNCGDVVASSGNNTFHFYQMSIKPEYAKIIDEYFTMFGYKTHRVKTPNKMHRLNYWYTKTIDVNIDGAVPMNDMRKIKECYNTGITFWRNALEIGNYSVDNPIVNLEV